MVVCRLAQFLPGLIEALYQPAGNSAWHSIVSGCRVLLLGIGKGSLCDFGFTNHGSRAWWHIQCNMDASSSNALGVESVIEEAA